MRVDWGSASHRRSTSTWRTTPRKTHSTHRPTHESSPTTHHRWWSHSSSHSHRAATSHASAATAVKSTHRRTATTPVTAPHWWWTLMSGWRSSFHINFHALPTNLLHTLPKGSLSIFPLTPPRLTSRPRSLTYIGTWLSELERILAKSTTQCTLNTQFIRPTTTHLLNTKLKSGSNKSAAENSLNDTAKLT